MWRGGNTGDPAVVIRGSLLMAYRCSKTGQRQESWPREPLQFLVITSSYFGASTVYKYYRYPGCFARHFGPGPRM